MSGIDQLIATALHERAGSDVDADALLGAATRRGRARRRRRRGRAVAAVVGLAVVVLGAWQWVPALGPYPSGPPAEAGNPLPTAPGEPGARSAPERVGSDPTLLHFAAPAFTARAVRYAWTSGPGYERLDASTADDGGVTVIIGKDLSDVPEMLVDTIREEPVPGLILVVSASSDQQAREVAAQVDLDRAQRCVVPIGLRARPSKAELSRCTVQFGPYGFESGGLTVTDRAGRSMEVIVTYSTGLRDLTPTHRVGDRPANLSEKGDKLALVGYPAMRVSVSLSPGLDLADAESMLASVEVASSVDRADAWPPPVVER